MKKEMILKLIAGSFTAMAIVTVAILAQTKTSAPIKYNPAYNDYITGFTSWEISKRDKIQVRFVDEQVKESKINSSLKKSPFDFSPSISGTTKWIDTRTIQFEPDNFLPQDKKYRASLDLKKIIRQIPDSLRNFEFEFKTIKQQASLIISENSTNSENINLCTVKGSVTSSDFESSDNIEKIVEAYLGDTEIELKWEHNPVSNYHQFSIEEIERTDEDQFVELVLKGRKVGLGHIDQVKKVTIPALNSFKVVDISSFNDPEQYINIEFSDPLQNDQIMDGLVSMGNQKLRTVITDNSLKIYPVSKAYGTFKLEVSKQLRNSLSHPLKEDYTTDITFEDIKPEVRLVKSGSILPQGRVLPFSFDAVNLSKAQVRVIKIKEKNIPQFLQVNNLNGNYQLRRVGEVLLKTEVDLGKGEPKDLKSWNKHTVDLAKLIKTEPGAIYHISVGFKKEHSLFTCTEEDTEVDDHKDMLHWGSDYEEQQPKRTAADFWSDYDNHYYSYNWQNRQNPCKNAYYRSNHVRSTNILASSLGMMAKKGNDKSMLIVMTDINTTLPIANAKVKVYNYQNRLLQTVTTNSQGIAKTKINSTPYLLVGSYGSQRGFLRVDNATSLSLSNFDISGQSTTQGLQGFIYGERGVWRPGDKIYLNFILEDKLKSLPANHPVGFEFRNPRGQIIQREVVNEGLNGFYTFHTKTETDAPTGNYQFNVMVGGRTFHKTIKVETVKPNRLKIKIDYGKDILSKEDANRKGKLDVKWLHGAEAGGLKANIAVQLKKSWLSFDTHKDFSFRQPNMHYDPERKVIFDEEIDEHGKADIPSDFKVNGAVPGKLTANFSIKVFEKGGNFSTDYFSIPYFPYKDYVGVKIPKTSNWGMLPTDKEHEIEFALVNAKGEKLQSGDVQVQLHKIDHRWWYHRYSGNFNYASDEYHDLIIEKTLSVKDGRASLNFEIPRQEWGQYLVRAKSPDGHICGKTFYLDWPEYYGRARSEKPVNSKHLTFSADKEQYNTGDMVKLFVPTSSKGRLFVSIEDDARVVKSFWQGASEGTTTVTFKATPNMAPNCYAHITYLQPHAQTINDLPIRMYGVAPINVHDKNSKLQPVITMPDVLRPEQKVSIKVAEERGKPMTYTLAVVDEGLLDLTHYQTPDVWTEFNKRQGLGVKTFDLFDHVIGAQQYSLKNLLSLGGDGSLKKDGGAKANRFKPVVKFFGPFHISPGQSRTTTFTMPNYVGSVKTMVIAGENGAYGHADKTTPVKNPLMVIGTMPRVLSPGEEVHFPVTVFAMEDKIKDVTVKVESNDLLIPLSSTSQKITFTSTGDQVVSFPFTVKEGIGIARVKAIVEGAGEKASYDVELDVRNPNPFVTNVYAQMLMGNEQWSKELSPVGMIGTNSAVVEVSNIPPINLGRRLGYLIRYPYGCVEQTTSSVFPQLYLTRLMDITPRNTKRISENIRSGINRLQRFQTSTGGFAYWPGRHDDNEWGTNYAGHFLLEAKSLGYQVPSHVLKDWTKFQKGKAKNWRDDGYRSHRLTQAYRLYLLAKAGKPEMGAMNKLKLNQDLEITARWYLAASYAIVGQTHIANDMINNLGTQVTSYRELGQTFGSSHRDQAIILEMLTVMDKKKQAAETALKVSQRLSGDAWCSTQTTAYMLIAMAKFVGEDGLSKENRFELKRTGQKTQTILTKSPIWQEDFRFNKLEKQTVEVSNKTDGILYARVINEGQPLAGDTTDANNKLSMVVAYYDMDGHKLDPERIIQGTDFYASVTINNNGHNEVYDEMALTHVFPSGWEIHNTRMNKSLQGNRGVDYEDFRDDRVNIFFDLYKNTKKEFRIYLTAAYAGKFYLPTVESHAMYDKSISSHRHGQWVQVIPHDQQ